MAALIGSLSLPFFQEFCLYYCRSYERRSAVLSLTVKVNAASQAASIAIEYIIYFK